MIDLLMSWVAPMAGGALAVLIAARLGAPWWAAIMIGFVGMFAGQVAMAGILAAVGIFVRRGKRPDANDDASR